LRRAAAREFFGGKIQLRFFEVVHFFEESSGFTP